MSIHALTASFNAGELSPQMDARVAVEKYEMGCRRLENFLNSVHGPITRRPGLEHLGTAASGTVPSRLVGLDFAESSIVLEFASGGFRFWRGGQLLSVPVLAHPYSDSEIFEVQTVTVNDVTYLVHPNHVVKILEHYADDDWRLREFHEPKDGWGEAAATVPPTGNAVCERWATTPRTLTATLANPLLGMDRAEDWAKNHTVTATQSASGAPAGRGREYAASVQRVKAWIVPATSGSYRFRFTQGNGVTGCRIYLELTAAGSGSGKISILSNAAATGLDQTSAGYSLTAGSAYYVEFWLNNIAAPDAGKIDWSKDGASFIPIPAAELAAAASGGGQGDSLIGWPAMLDENIEDITIAASGVTGDVTLTGSADIWTPEHVGAWWQIAHRRETAFSELVGNGNVDPDVGEPFSGASSAVRVAGRYEVTSYGIWEGTVHLEEMGADGTWQVIRTWVGKKDRNISIVGQADQETQLRLRVPSGAEGYSDSTAAAPRFIIEAADAKIYGLVRITGYTSATSVTARVYSELWATDATPWWTEGAWSNAQGFPRSSCLHEQRTVFGGTRKRPQSVWASVLGDFENFRRSSLDDGSWLRLLASENAHVIQWMISYDALVIGTTRGFWVCESPDGGVLTPTAGKFTRRSGAGSAYVQAVLANESILFVQKNGITIRRLSYRDDIHRFGSSDLTVLADHITAGGIRQLVWQGERRAILWCVMNDGRLCGMTLEEEQNVFAWHQHNSAGADFLSVARISGQETDEVWFTVRRDGVIYIERFEPGTYAENEAARDAFRWLHADAGKIFQFEDLTATITGMEHLNGKLVKICGDGAYLGEALVIAGAVTLPQSRTARVISAGLAYTSLVQKMKLELPMQDGASRGRKFKVSRVALELLNSAGGRVSDDADARAAEIEYREPGDAMDTAVPLFTGQREVQLESAHRNSVDVLVATSDPQPFTLVAATVMVEVFNN